MTRPAFLPGVPFQAVAWDTLPATSHPGEHGTATFREVQAGPYRLRHVTYSPDYRSDHYCDLGHAAFVIRGEIEIQLRGGEPVRLAAGSSFVVGTGAEPHLVLSADGAELFVLD